MRRDDVLSTAYLAGRVRRYHTWPVLHQQTVGEHTWQCLRLYCHLFGPPEPAVTEHLVWHDAGELRTGDIPFPVKRDNLEIKDCMDVLERAAVVAMGGPALPALSLLERTRCKCVDLLEMFEFGLVELTMGSAYAQPIVDDTLRVVHELIADLPKADRQRIEAYVENRGMRLPWGET